MSFKLSDKAVITISIGKHKSTINIYSNLYISIYNILIKYIIYYLYII